MKQPYAPSPWKVLLTAAMALGLAACNSDDDDAPPPETPGNTYGVTSGNKLISFNRDAPGNLRTSVAITGLNAGEKLLGVDFRPADGAFYGLTDAARIVTIDLTSGAATLKSTLAADPADIGADGTPAFTALAGAAYGVDFNPVPDRLRVVSDSGQNLRINVDTGATTTDGTINPAPKTIGAVAYTKSFKEACRTVLYTIDAQTDTLYRQDPPNNGTQVAVGPLGIDVATTGGFDILGADDSAIAALTVAGATGFYTLNLGTGAATSIGSLALPGGETLAGLGAPIVATSPAQAQGELLGLTTGNKLVSFNRGSPGKLCSSVAVTGFGGGENLHGIDVRPADGALYTLSSSGRLFTLDRTTGAATLKAALSADPADTTAAFTALAGTDFGLDFNPVPDRLRVVSNSGQNLRINVDNGATTTDGDLNTATVLRTGISGAAYTNSIGGGNAATLGTTLYYLDSSSDQLLTTAAPNDGTVTVVGALGADIGAVDGFEIDGRSNAAFIAVNTGGAAGTTLHTVNLVTGAASAATGTVGGGEALRGLTLNAGLTATAWGLTTSGNLVSFAPATPGTIVSSVAITGLAADESLLGIDYRPATGKLFALASSGKLYTLNETSGAATAAATLAAVAGDDSPFTALSGVEFGIDFNPVPDRLRVVSDAEQNLRINVDSGAATTDTNLISGTAGDVVGAAYINSYAGATSTALYAVGAVSNSLMLIGANPATGDACPGGTGNPNCGAVNVVGVLGADITEVGDIDFAGGANGYTLGAFQTTAGGVSGLYRITLTTGAATKVADIATADGAALRGLALQVK